MHTITDYLKDDHRLCDELLSRMEHEVVNKNWEAAEERFRLFHENMERHLAMEETVLFPAFEEATGVSPMSGPTAVMRSEHLQIRGLMMRMVDCLNRRDMAGLIGHGETFSIMLGQHNVKEEAVLYPMADRALSEKRREILDAMHHISGVLASCELNE
jgi:hemerythrin-like domain-containing protein